MRQLRCRPLVSNEKGGVSLPCYHEWLETIGGEPKRATNKNFNELLEVHLQRGCRQWRLVTDGFTHGEAHTSRYLQWAGNAHWEVGSRPTMTSANLNDAMRWFQAYQGRDPAFLAQVANGVAAP